MPSRMILVLVWALGPVVALAQPRVWIADQGGGGAGYNRILEIDPVNHNPSGPDGSDVFILNTVPSPAGAFLDELTFDNDGRLWCVVKEDSDQDPDGAKRINKDTGAIDNPPGLITPNFPGEVCGGFLEGLAWDGTALWVSAVRSPQTKNMLTRVDPMTGNQVAPFDSGPLGARGFVDIPAACAQGLLWEFGNGGYGWLWHSDPFAQKIYKLDISLLFTDPLYDPYDEERMVVAEFAVPFKPKGMDWMEDKIWVAAPAGGPWNPAVDAGIWEFNPANGATQKLFNTPQWSLDGLAILGQGPRIVLSTDTIESSVWIGTGNPPDDVFTVANGGTETLNYNVEIEGDPAPEWLEVFPVAGSLTSEEEPDSIAVTYSVAGYLAGVYTATIAVTGNAWNSPKRITVTVTVETVRPDLDGDADVDQDDFGLFQACCTGTGKMIDDEDCRPADFDQDNYVDRDDLDIFFGCTSGANVAADPSCDDPP